MSINKILITGTSCSGKTTLGRELGLKLNLFFTDLDDLYWLPNWTPREEIEFDKRVKEKFNEERWVITGNYSRFANIMWPKADMIIWLDLPLKNLLWRGLKRSLKLIINRETTCNGNRESFSRLFCRKSIFYYILRGYPRRKRTNSLYFEGARNTPQKLVRLRTAKEVESFLVTFSQSSDQTSWIKSSV